METERERERERERENRKVVNAGFIFPGSARPRVRDADNYPWIINTSVGDK